MVVLVLLAPSGCIGGRDSPDYSSQTPEGAFARPAGEAGGRGRAGAPQLSATPGARRLPRCASLDPTGDSSMVRASTVGAHLPASGLDIFGDPRKMNKRQLYYQVLNFAMILSSALMI